MNGQNFRSYSFSEVNNERPGSSTFQTRIGIIGYFSQALRAFFGLTSWWTGDCVVFASGVFRLFFGNPSGNPGVFIGSSRRTPEELSKPSRSRPEEIPKQSRSNPEAAPKPSRSSPECFVLKKLYRFRRFYELDITAGFSILRFWLYMCLFFLFQLYMVITFFSTHNYYCSIYDLKNPDHSKYLIIGLNGILLYFSELWIIKSGKRILQIKYR